MKADIFAITIAAANLQELKTFYIEKFGWEVQNENPSVVMFKFNTLTFTLLEQQLFDTYTGEEVGAQAGAKFYLTINLVSKLEVDQFFDHLNKAGVTIVKAPETVFWGGYSGIVQDLELNHWEICYNPLINA